ncbi:hypothetical protein TSAR_012352 [Trichomalopsis sarcophagae]|uniref:LCN-type CS-alpha/beta domain-containing protein n=1 Tax=Trichomalopsis sarcophagae TaxID=543379 RepID=A0A232ENI4_9HYME|nr:hypothetical protein TSAR_012352 [Trichomalopsis sarcophagae]
MKYTLFILLLIAVLLAESVYGCTQFQNFKCAGKCFFNRIWQCYDRVDGDYDCICI